MKLSINSIEDISLAQFNEIVQNSLPIQFADSVWKEVEASYAFLQEFSSDKLIYGINTGFGPMAQYRIDTEDQKQLQLNLIRSHASGTGSILGVLACRATFLARIFNFSQAKSGIHPDLLRMMLNLWNADAVPVIYEHGGVGASGDLVQLAHVALGLLGEGEFYYKEKIVHAKDLFKELKLTPMNIYIREGLALMNGTSCMAGMAALNVFQAKKLVQWGMLSGLWINELMNAYDDHFSLALNQAKKHEGQLFVAQQMTQWASTSRLLRDRRKDWSEDLTQEKIIQEKVQEYYSLRCLPQILGPIYDTILMAEKNIINELNSVSDNPIIDHKANMIYHGGNFHGDYVSFTMDQLKISITKLSMLLERQFNYLLNPQLNQKFPPFLNKGTLGLEFGMQGMQYPAVSNTAENQTLSNPMYVHSIPNNNDNQDIVSMGANAALMTKKVIDNTYEILSIYLIALLEASSIKGKKELFSEPIQEVLLEFKDFNMDTHHKEAPYSLVNKMVATLKNR